ncbi:MAG: glycosyltransferase, partial [Anaerolineales bacterium]
VPHDELIARYTRARLAIDVMRRNPERELAFTTRTVEYLWCGLPVIYHDYAELSDYIRQYNAGWIVNPEDRAALAATFDEILQDPEQIAERGRNAQRLVRERLTWDRTMGPVDRFVRHPRVRSRPLRAPERSRVPRGTRVLWEQARFYYRAGGVKTLTTAGAAWLRRWFKLRVNTLRG